jgi:hypothetical protein
MPRWLAICIVMSMLASLADLFIIYEAIYG